MGRGGQEGDAAYGPGDGGAGGTGVPLAACALLPGAAATMCDATEVKPGVLGLAGWGACYEEEGMAPRRWMARWLVDWGLGGVAVRRVMGVPSRGGA